MKKFFVAVLAFSILIFSASAQAKYIQVDYGDSKIFTRCEIATCMEIIEKNLNEWGCTLKSVRYVGDEISNTKENIKYLNELAESRNFQKKFSKCLLFETDFISPPDPHDGKITAWNYDSEYKNYGWYFGFYEVDGEWKLLTSGY
ncbi:MAG: hypothetical protein IJT06_03740 [Selenomonadaceae bacterium]|nr:hypothetical protein [Selenomonadaceae bacterium]